MSSEHSISRFLSFAYLIVEKEDPVSISTLYLSILHIRLFHIEGLKDNVISTLRNIGLRDADLVKAIGLLDELEKYIEEIKRNADLLEKVEEEYYHRFATALYTFIKGADFGSVEKYAQVFIKLKKVSDCRTRKGSFKTWLNPDRSEDQVIINIISGAQKTGFLTLILPGLKKGYHVIIPAPYVDVFSKISKYVVASVLSDLGFKAEVNKKFTSGTSTIAVDVWATKEISKYEFRVYVSCEKWDSTINMDDVNSEQMRIKQLPMKPHLKILVAKSVEENARRIAFNDGFIVIELGSGKPDVEELHKTISAEIKNIFLGLIPDNIKRALQDLVR